MKCIYVPTMIALGLSLSSPAHAQTHTFRPSSQSAQLPEDLGYPRDGTRRGGGSRGGVCDLPPDVPPLTALMPDTITWTGPKTDSEMDPEIVFSLTHRSDPQLWFYLPYQLRETSQVNFTLKDVTGETLSRTRLDTVEVIPAAPSIINVALGQIGVSLPPETEYQWYLTVRCNEGPPITVNGWVRHQSDDRLPAEARRRFFVDSLSELAPSLVASPEDRAVQAEWQALLESVGLGNIATAPVIDCCSFVE